MIKLFLFLIIRTNLIQNASIPNHWSAVFIACISTISMSMRDSAINGGITFKIMIVPTTCQGNGRTRCSSNHVLVLVIKRCLSMIVMDVWNTTRSWFSYTHVMMVMSNIKGRISFKGMNMNVNWPSIPRCKKKLM